MSVQDILVEHRVFYDSLDQNIDSWTCAGCKGIWKRTREQALEHVTELIEAEIEKIKEIEFRKGYTHAHIMNTAIVESGGQGLFQHRAGDWGGGHGGSVGADHRDFSDKWGPCR